ncbi:MAG: DUF1328 domain-containing protein [Parachlamydiaceae bacterium]|nr:DUF1328 domain-containing protein [Parachlamydiaceae bacterium]
MLKLAFIFLIIAIIAGALGLPSVAKISGGISKSLFFIFFVFFVILLFLALTAAA